MRGEDLRSQLDARGEDAEDDGAQLLPDLEGDQLGGALPEALAEDLPGAGERQAGEGDQGQAQLDQGDEGAPHQQPHQSGLITSYLGLL